MITLAEAIKAKGLPGDCVVVPFDALYRGHLVKVTAVLKRTAVYEDDRPYERHLDLLEKFEVAELRWQDLPTSVLERQASHARGRANARGKTPWRRRSA